MITETEIQQLRSRVNELDDRLKFLYRRLDIDYATDPNSDPINSPLIQTALRSGNKIEVVTTQQRMR